jgi:hypothetical protein
LQQRGGELAGLVIGTREAAHLVRVRVRVGVGVRVRPERPLTSSFCAF